MNISDDDRDEYVKSHSHVDLAKKWKMSLSALSAYAEEQGWDKEHKLYWQDVALEVLKKETEAYNLVATKELLKAMGIARPVGRPSKVEVQRHIALEAKIAAEYDEDVSRLKLVGRE